MIKLQHHELETRNIELERQFELATHCILVLLQHIQQKELVDRQLAIARLGALRNFHTVEWLAE